MQMTPHCSFILTGICFWFLSSFDAVSAGSREPLVIGFFHRPPYYIKGDKPSGFLLDRTRLILEKSGVPFQFEEMSINRIMMDVKNVGRPFCSVGWYKTVEREKFALFTDAIYRNQSPQILVRSTDKEKFDAYSNFKSLIADKLCPGLAEGFSYGNDIDPIIRKKQTECGIGDADHDNLLKMLVAKRFDYLIVAPIELDDLLAKSGINRKDVVMRPFADMPEGETRFLMCNKLMRPEDILAINKAIGALQ